MGSYGPGRAWVGSRQVIDIRSINAEFVLRFWPIIHFSDSKRRFCQESMARVRIPMEDGYPWNQAVELIKTLLELIKSKLVSGEDVLISEFGKFFVKDKRERRGRNPATSEDMMLEARRVVTFRCLGQLIGKINQ